LSRQPAWLLIPHWVKEANGARKPINAKSETIAKLPSCRDGRVEPMYEIDGSFCYRH
jgi:putative SOS response-associated peptidase YedK